MKNNRNSAGEERIIYVPSYTLSRKDPSRLTYMSFWTAMKGIEIMRQGLGDKIIFSTAYDWWKTEAELKKDLASKSGISRNEVEIIPAITDSYDEAEKLSKIVTNPGTTLILVAHKYHAHRAAKALMYFFNNIKVVKVSTGTERQLDPSWLKSFCCSSKINFILWNLFFGLITPWMMRRQMRKEGR